MVESFVTSPRGAQAHDPREAGGVAPGPEGKGGGACDRRDATPWSRHPVCSRAEPKPKPLPFGPGATPPASRARPTRPRLIDTPKRSELGDFHAISLDSASR